MHAAAPPNWVGELRTAEAQRQRADAARRASEPVSAGDLALSTGFMLLVTALGLGGVILPVRSVRRWAGGWRIAAAIPCVIMAFVILRIVIGVALDPTSHNLWPFEILTVATVSLLYLGALAFARRFLRA